MNLKCFFGFHAFVKFGGPMNMGDGRFRQEMVCGRCKKMKEVIS